MSENYLHYSPCIVIGPVDGSTVSGNAAFLQRMTEDYKLGAVNRCFIITMLPLCCTIDLNTMMIDLMFVMKVLYAQNHCNTITLHHM